MYFGRKKSMFKKPKKYRRKKFKQSTYKRKGGFGGGKILP